MILITKRQHFIRATLESIAYQSYSVLHAMEQDVETDITTLKVDGGASANDFLMQFQADISRVKVVRPAMMEATAAGAAYLAGLAVGFFKDREEIKDKMQASREFTSEMSDRDREELLAGWHKAVDACRS